MLKEIIKDKIDIFLISETKFDGSFPSGQFIIKGYSTPFRSDRNQYFTNVKTSHVRF